jgi:hypothetical protein
MLNFLDLSRLKISQDMSIVDEDVVMSEARVESESGQASNDESGQVLIIFFSIFIS